MGSQGTKPSEADSFLGTVIQKVSYGFESKLPECQPADLRQKRCRKRIWCILTLKSDIWLHQVLPVFLRINEHTAQLLVPSNAVWPANQNIGCAIYAAYLPCWELPSPSKVQGRSSGRMAGYEAGDLFILKAH